MTSYIREQGAILANQGYMVCAIAPGAKRPIGNNWGDTPLSEEECERYYDAAAGVGIICGKGARAIYGLDFDIEGDEELAADMESWLCLFFDKRGGALMKRTGKPPKFLIPVRGEPGMKKTTTEFFRKGDAKARLEILGEGQQFVAYHIHPATGEPYQWARLSDSGMWSTEQDDSPCDELAHSRPDELSRIDADAVAAIKAKFAELAEKHGWLRESYKQANNVDADSFLDTLAPEQVPVGLSIAEARTYIKEVKADDYDEWLAVGMALHFEFGGAPEALELWNEWSSGSPSYKDFADLQYRWERFGSHRDRKAKTMRTYIARYNRSHVNPAAELTEKGLAARAANYYRGSLIYATAPAQWYFFNGKHWERISEVHAKGLLWAVIQDELYREVNEVLDDSIRRVYQRFYDHSQTAATVNHVSELLKQMPGMFVRSFSDKANYRYFGVANGDIDLETLELLPPLASRFTAEAATAVYKEGAKCPLWEETLKAALGGDDGLVDYVQRIFGYAMLGQPKEEVLPIFYGNGGNGKSTIINAVRSIMGGAATTVEADTLTSMGGPSAAAGGARADIVSVFGKRLVVVPETDQQARFKEAAVKRMVSTDELSARGLYCKEPERVKPTWVPIMMTNYLPRIDGDDEGIWRRIAAVPFKGYFPMEKRDVNRAEKLRQEYPGILNWLLDGVKKYREKGLVPPKSVIDDTASYRGEMDVLSEFFEDRCIARDDSACPTSVLFTAWQRFSQANGYEHLFKTKTIFSQRLARRGIKVKQKWFEGKSQRCYVGVALRDDFDAIDDGDEEEDWI